MTSPSSSRVQQKCSSSRLKGQTERMLDKKIVENTTKKTSYKTLRMIVLKLAKNKAYDVTSLVKNNTYTHQPSS